ncbi:histidine--tRNA ligase [Namhaeicola litoreus]|uniref:Histidine--tRNA ligase n=1 Tax=Namhaeicola litoreus TaxID=1052145 RepID=A0ABW3Y270_9FLAO
MKPNIPKGTRDFGPEELAKRNYLFQTISKEFLKFGFQPIETPSFENSSTLMGKYGEEGDRLIFKILNSGDFKTKELSNIVREVQLLSLTVSRIFKDVLNDLDKFEIEVGRKPNFYELERNKNELKSFIEEKYQYRVNQNISLIIGYIDSHKSIERLFLEGSISELFKDKIFEFFNKYIGITENTSERLENNEMQKLFPFIEEVYGKIIDELSEYRKRFSKNISNEISEKALRYDLTVPFARYVAQHQNEITFPFKRYQIQPVWRADRPQKGRFREFYQCDADVVGSDSLWQEVEFVQLYDAVFTELKLPVIIKLNNRKILAGIAELIGESDKLIDFTVALDKLDKIGIEKVTEEMKIKGISDDAIEKVRPLLTLQGDNFEKLEQIDALLKDSHIGKKGVEELTFVLRNLEKLGLESSELLLDITLARGLNYYTGAIFEVQAKNVEMGSVGGGGRYDDLTGIFGLKGISGVGISFGLDRIYLVLEELNLFEKVKIPKPKALFINFGEDEALYSLKAIKRLRFLGISSELFPNADKLKKQLNYANKREIEYVVMAGVEEIEKGIYTLKNMIRGDQTNCDLNDLALMLGNK